MLLKMANSRLTTLPCLTKYYMEHPYVSNSFLVLHKATYLNNSDKYQIQRTRLLHTSPIHKDMENAFKAIGAGIAATGVIGPGIGLGILFGNMVSATARNPSMANKLFQIGIMGAAFCESVAFFALMISFVAIA